MWLHEIIIIMFFFEFFHLIILKRLSLECYAVSRLLVNAQQ